MRRGEDSPVNHALLRESVLQSVAYLESKVYLQEKEVYELVRGFFKEYLGLDYEFTHDELLIELQNVFYDKGLEDKVLKFLRRISKIEYSDEELKPEELKLILKEFEGLVDMLIRSKKKSKGFFQKLFSFKEKKIKNEEVPVDEKEDEEVAEVIEDMEKEVSVDAKKDLFSEKTRVKEEKRMIDENKKIHPSKMLELSADEKKNEEVETKDKTKEKIEETSQISSSLAALTDELNNHIESEREIKHGKKEEKEFPIATTEEKKEEIEIPLPKEKNNAEQGIEEKHEHKKIHVKPAVKEALTIDEMIIKMKEKPSKELYKDLQAAYALLPEEKKGKYYQEVMDAFNLVSK